MRQDVVALTVGLGFIVFILGMMWLWGELKGWYAPSGYFYDDANSTQDRFLPEPYGCDDPSLPGRNVSGCVGTWYFWKLTPAESTQLTKAIVWLLYALHQIFIWGLIYRAQLTVAMQKIEDSKGSPYSHDLRWFNWGMLLVNALFHVLHLVQTHTTYDGTAQDVSISSSQSSVIMMVCFILLIEYQNRGLILMWPTPQSQDKVANALRLHPGPLNLVRKYHGYIFAWACIYTFWYHPMENTWGHTLGFFHTAIVLLQGSLAFTSIHLNKYWRLLNECWVFIHATTVAVQTGNPAMSARSDLWPIFCFGFGFVFAFTQVFSFPFWKKIPTWCRIIPPVIYLAVVTALCGTIVEGRDGASGYSRMVEMVFIPSQEYLQAILSWFFLYIFIWIEWMIKKSKTVPDKPVMPSPTKQALYLCGYMLIYVSFILGSYFYQKADYAINMTTMMIVFTFIFSIGVCIGTMFMKELLGPSEPLYVKATNVAPTSHVMTSTQHDNEAFEHIKM